MRGFAWARLYAPWASAIGRKAKSLGGTAGSSVEMSQRAHSSSADPVRLTYFSSWFCPFAHRSTIALEHHRDVLQPEWIEALGWEQRAPTGNEDFEADERSDWWYHWKSPELLSANPLGMIPTIVGPNGRVVRESIVCIEFLDELAAAAGAAAPRLLPGDPYDRAANRVAADRASKTVCSAYYQVLVRETAEDRRAGFEKICAGLLEFTAGLSDDPDVAPFYGGASAPTLADCVLLPHAHRLYAIEHYRGLDFALPTRGEAGLWERWHRYLADAERHPTVAPTLPDRARYLKHVAKYAHNQARSKVGNAARRGVDPLSYDDKIDGDPTEK